MFCSYLSNRFTVD